MPSIETNGITIEFDETGHGDPLLLVMGLGGQLTAWRDDFVGMLATAGFRVIRFDNRDTGLSTHLHDEQPPGVLRSALGHMTGFLPGAPYPLSAMADDAVGLLDALDIEAAHIVGASMGGMISQLVALNHPTRALSLTSIMSTTGNRRVGRAKSSVLGLLAKHSRSTTPEAAVESSLMVFRAIAGPDRDEDDHRTYSEMAVRRDFDLAGTARQAAAISAAPDRTKRLRELDLPTLVIHGQQDPLVAPSGGHATAEAIPGAKLVLLKNMGHSLPKSLWPNFTAAIAANADRTRVS